MRPISRVEYNRSRQLRAGDSATGAPFGAELTHRGYAFHSVTPERWTAEYRIVADVKQDGSEVTTFGTYAVDAGTNIVTKVA